MLSSLRRNNSRKLEGMVNCKTEDKVDNKVNVYPMEYKLSVHRIE